MDSFSKSFVTYYVTPRWEGSPYISVVKLFFSKLFTTEGTEFTEEEIKGTKFSWVYAQELSEELWSSNCAYGLCKGIWIYVGAALCRANLSFMVKAISYLQFLCRSWL